MKRLTLVQGGLLLLCVAGLMAGCSSGGGRVRAVNLDEAAYPGLSPYNVVTVSPFTLGPDARANSAVGAQMAEGIAQHLRTDFGPVFLQVRTGAPLRQDNEMVILGVITEYEPGGQEGLFGGPRLNGTTTWQDASDTQDLARGKFDQLRASAGMSGQSQDMEHLMADTEAAIAFNIARAKGWKPAGPPR
jgi:hypothetical protein